MITKSLLPGYTKRQRILETVEELQEFIDSVLQSGIRKNLFAQGEARAIIRKQGQLPDEAPAFVPDLDTRLSGYGFSLLRASLALREQQDGNSDVYQDGFLKAGNAFEALVRNGSSDVPEHGFWRVMGAASYHLAGYAAMAFSLIKQGKERANLAPAERAITRLLVSDLQTLRQEAEDWLSDPEHRDKKILAILEEGRGDVDDILSIILTTSVYRSYAFFEFALLTGERKMYRQAMSILRRSLRVASDTGSVSMWWIIRVAANLIDNLWANSLHQIIPVDGPKDANTYSILREMLLASLYSRGTSEVELWPSQIDAANRAVNLNDHLVVSLPTSAGKTRIAEICAFMCLSAKKRVLFVTPLRALSAQTERIFRKTFAPLGFSISSLYGASGAMPDDQNALRLQNIVIATPEKLDFALRSDPQIIDDVGLIVFDEGHTIGLGERELRYEVLVQKLLRRKDAGGRRIVCLSAILPDDEQFDDFTAWIRSDVEGEAIKLKWRPTRQRFGTLTWKKQSARLEFDFDDDKPFIPKFVSEQPDTTSQSTLVPTDNRQLTLAAAWKFADEGKRTLIFYTQRNHLEGCAQEIVNLSKQGCIPSLLKDPDAIKRAKSIGAEWLGADHPAVQCLDVGVAIHHGRLPKPFLREVERLLNENILTVTVASPTLAQGLNLNVAVLLIPNLHRAGEEITEEEFANVAGRAGRAFVDIEGLVILTIFEPTNNPETQAYQRAQGRNINKRKIWRNFVKFSHMHKLESGLIQIANKILQYLERNGTLDSKDAFEYLANSRNAWDIEDNEEDNKSFEVLREKLDHVIFALVEALDADAADLPRLIDECLNGSLWARQIARLEEGKREKHLNLFKARSRLIWSQTTVNQRQGYFVMGVGLDAGLMLDKIVDELAILLDRADSAALLGDSKILFISLSKLAERLLSIRPFKLDDSLPENLHGLLSKWISGTPVNEIGPENIEFIEDVFAYRLVWAVEALRTRRIALGWQPDGIAGAAAACLEVGLPQYAMAMLVRSGLPSREAAMVAVSNQNPTITDYRSLVKWLNSDEIASLTNNGNWPTPETSEIWSAFRDEILKRTSSQWTSEEWRQNVKLDTQQISGAKWLYRVKIEKEGTASVLTPDFDTVATLQSKITDPTRSVLKARFEDSNQIIIRRLGRSIVSSFE